MPSGTAREFQNAARRLGFVKTPQTGSHERWNHPDGRGAVTIALHGGREIGPPLFYKILRQLGITQEQFQSLR
ncbi:MAG: type II toxin-antitoxin system HicA family toxin [Candidatus Korobacteraceae bacterium]